jgi:predicted DNA-binding protein with PD1-like motif
MRINALLSKSLIAITAALLSVSAGAQVEQSPYISPARPVPAGKAPGMQVRQIGGSLDEKVYVVIFRKGDEALSGLTDFAIRNKIEDAHFTAIGAEGSATLAWLDLSRKAYKRIDVKQQAEVLSLIGDIAMFDGKPIVHMHAVLGKQDGSTVGGHVFELNVNPTLEVFVTVDTLPLQKKSDDASGMKLIDPAQ